jgi:hypothetical protein
MLILSLFLFAVVLLVLAVAFSRGLSNMDDILQVVEPGTPDATPARSLTPAEG